MKLRVGQLVKLNPKQHSAWVNTDVLGIVIKMRGKKQAKVAWCDGTYSEQWYWSVVEVG